MSYTFRKSVLATAVVGAFGFLLIANAQDARRGDSGENRTTRDHADHIDQVIIRWMATGDKAEIELAKIAQQNAGNQKVKDFAKKMIEDHSQCLSNLTGMKHDHQGQPVNSGTNRSGPQQNEAQGGGHRFEFIRIKEQVCEEMLEHCKKELMELKGEEFDKCYMSGQVKMHQEMIATGKALKPHASSDLQAKLETCGSKAKEHLEQAKQICEEIKKSSKS
jgi:predicted outer membrane protein